MCHCIPIYNRGEAPCLIFWFDGRPFKLANSDGGVEGLRVVRQLLSNLRLVLISFPLSSVLIHFGAGIGIFETSMGSKWIRVTAISSHSVIVNDAGKWSFQKSETSFPSLTTFSTSPRHFPRIFVDRISAQ